MFEASFQTSTFCHMGAGVAEGRIISPILFSLYVNDMPSSSPLVGLGLYAYAVIATSCQPALLGKYLETYPCDSVEWLREWWIAINVLKSTAMLFVKAGRHIPKPQPVQLFWEPIHWVETACYLGMILDTRLIWSMHIDEMKKKATQGLGVLGPLLNRGSELSLRNGVLLYKQLIHPDGLLVPSLEVLRSLPYKETAGTAVQVYSHCYQCTLVRCSRECGNSFLLY